MSDQQPLPLEMRYPRCNNCGKDILRHFCDIGEIQTYWPAAPPSATPHLARLFEGETRCANCQHGKYDHDAVTQLGHQRGMNCAVYDCKCAGFAPALPSAPGARESAYEFFSGNWEPFAEIVRHMSSESVCYSASDVIKLFAPLAEAYAASREAALLEQLAEARADYTELAKRTNKLEHMMGEISMVLRKDIQDV